MSAVGLRRGQGLRLRKFGLPPDTLNMISAIYSERTFSVKDPLGNSKCHSQSAGIAQGCPLSPLLFLIVGQAIKISFDLETQLKGIGINEKFYKLLQSPAC